MRKSYTYAVRVPFSLIPYPSGTSVNSEVAKTVANRCLPGKGWRDRVVRAGGNSILLVVVCFHTASAWAQSGTPLFATPRSFPIPRSATQFVTADLNRDGKLDIVTPNDAGTVSVLLGNGDGTFQPRSDYVTGPSPTSIVAGDVNRDSNVDIVTLGSNGVSVLLGNGDGTLEPKSDYAPGFQGSQLAIGDLNRDGAPDLAVADWGYLLAVLLGAGDGSFPSRTDYPVPAMSV